MKKTTYYFAVYNPETKETACQCEIAEDEKTVDAVEGYPYQDELYHNYQRQRWALDAINRGQPWTLYCEPEPFDFANMNDGIVLTGSMKKALKEATK